MKKVFLFFLVLLAYSKVSAQGCALVNNAYGSANAPTAAGVPVDISFGCNYAGEYATIIGCAASTTYKLTATDNNTASPSPTYVTVYNPSNGYVAFGGDLVAGASVTFTTTIAGDYKVMITTAGPPGCGTDATCRTVYVECMSCNAAVCGNSICEEDYCICDLDCACPTIFVDYITYDSGSPAFDTIPSLYCGGDFGFPNSVIMPVAISTTLPCITEYDVSTDLGTLRQLDGSTVTTIPDFTIFWVVLNDAATATADTLVDITVTDVTYGPGGCGTINTMFNVSGFIPSSFCSCSDTLVLDYVETSELDYVANDIIQSTDTIEAGANIDHEAGIFVDLLAGFWAKSGCTFAAFIGACDSAGGVVAKMAHYLTPKAYDENIHNYTTVEGKSPKKVAKLAGKGSSLAQLSAGTLNVSPNPAADMALVQFSLPQAAKATVELFDMQGRLVKTLFTGETQETQVQINTGELTSGLYLVKMQSAYGQESVRLMVK